MHFNRSVFFWEVSVAKCFYLVPGLLYTKFQQLNDSHISIHSEKGFLSLAVLATVACRELSPKDQHFLDFIQVFGHFDKLRSILVAIPPLPSNGGRLYEKF